MRNKILKINEFFFNDTKDLYIDRFSEEEYDTLISLSANNMGILNEYDIYIWCGFNPNSNDIRVKITNNKKYKDKTFVINVNTLELIGEYDSEVITDNVLKNIFRWVKLNTKPLNDFSDNGNVDSFMKNIAKIS